MANIKDIADITLNFNQDCMHGQSILLRTEGWMDGQIGGQTNTHTIPKFLKLVALPKLVTHVEHHG